MKVPNKLSKMLSTAGEKAAYDNACKKLLSNKIILAWIMKSCLQEYRECAIQEIAEKYIEGDLYVSEIPVYPDEETPEFKMIDGLITNFHLPESTLVMLVSALAGKENILHAYEVAVQEKYRFFSFGDAMLIL